MSRGELLATTADKWVDTGDGKLFAQVSGEGPPILLIHGWAMDHRVFTPQLPALSQKFSVIAYDRRGFGRSEAPHGLDLELDDIDRLLDELAGGKPTHLLGMSQGGRIALRYAITRPKRLRSLILQGAVVDGLAVNEPEEERIPMSQYAELARQGRLDEVRKLWLEHPMTAVGDHHAEAAALLERMLLDTSDAVFVEFTPESYRFPHDLLGAVARLGVPTLILTGARDTVARREHAAKLVKTTPDAREVIFHDSGHLSNLTEPARYNRVVRGFCTGVDSGISLSNDPAQD